MATWLVELSKQLDKHPKTDFTYPSIKAESEEDAKKAAIEKAKDENLGYKIWIREIKKTVN